MDSRVLYPPRDFMPTSAVWGFWVAAWMASRNWAMMGQQTRGRRLLFTAVVAQMVLWLLFITGIHLACSIFGGASGEVIWTWPPIATRMLIAGLMMIVNGAVGYGLYRSQSEAVSAWTSTQPTPSVSSPYVSWQFSIMVISATLIIALVFLALVLSVR